MSERATTDLPRLRIVTLRRETPFRLGIGLAIGGLALTIGGGVLLAGDQAVQLAAASDRAEVPELLVFDAEARRYEVVLRPAPGIAVPYIPDPVAALRCDVERADGTRQQLGDGETVRVETSFGTSIGSFEAAPGRTVVACSFPSETSTSNYFVTVAPRREALRVVALALLVAGVVAMAIGTGLIIIGVRGRAVAV